jgi:hypothetical protein
VGRDHRHMLGWWRLALASVTLLGIPALAVAQPSTADADNDGIPDRCDYCPKQVETVNGRFDMDGCPDGPDHPSWGHPANFYSSPWVIGGFWTNRADVRIRHRHRLRALVARLDKRITSVLCIGQAGAKEHRAVRLSRRRAKAICSELAKLWKGRVKSVGIGARPLAGPYPHVVAGRAGVLIQPMTLGKHNIWRWKRRRLVTGDKRPAQRLKKRPPKGPSCPF